MNDSSEISRDSQVDSREEDLEKPGALLKAARERQGLSVEEVAKELYLTRSKVRALESDEYDKLQSDVFIKGYLRKYAPLVGLDAEQLVAQFHDIYQQIKQAQAEEEDNEEEVPNTLVPKFIVPAALFGAAGVAAISIFVFIGNAGEPGEATVTPVSDANTTLTERVAESDDGNPVVEDNAPAPNLDRELAAEALELAAREQAVALPPSETVNEAATPTEQASNSAPVVASNSAAITGDNPELRLEFSEDCWVEVRDHIDNLLYYDMAKAGENIELQGEPPFSMTLGNAQAVTLYWGDELIDTSPRPGNRTAKIVVGESDE